MARPREPRPTEPGVPYLLATSDEFDPVSQLKVRSVKNPLANATLGDLGLAARVDGPDRFPAAVLVQPFDRPRLAGLDAATIRVFRADPEGDSLQPVWNSGVNLSFGYAWATVSRPGVFVPIGLPRDRLLQELLRRLAERRALLDSDSPDEHVELTREGLAVFLEAPEDALEELRATLATVEVKTALGGVPPDELRFRQGGHLVGFPLPGDSDLGELRRRLKRLKTPRALAEEALFFPPEIRREGEPPWPRRPDAGLWDGIARGLILQLAIWKYLKPSILCWLLSRNWWMYHANERHTGTAAGCSDIRSTNVSSMVLQSDIAVDGTVVTIPSIVDGKIYVGTGGYGTMAGTLYKIDLATGTIEGRRPVSGDAYYSYDGIGGSPAVVGGRVYFTGIHGKVYCVDAATMTASPPHPAPLWTVDLKNADSVHNQPVRNPLADCWSSPLVVNGKVYVASGEGETNSYSFIYCLDAATGTVLWLFCTNQFVAGTNNSPNVIPQANVGLSPLPGMFSTAPNPPEYGAAPWSSCAYDRALNRVYVGTGNSGPDTPLPDPLYASGIISLDADTGQFKGFFQPAPGDSYKPTDLDVDVPAAPMIFSRGTERVVCIGSKNGSFFLLHPDTLQVLGGGAQRRQLLPRNAATGAELPTVDPHFGFPENKWGVLGTAAVHSGLGKLFVGLGGYQGIDDHNVTPFLRALDWNTLADAWPTAVQTIGGNPVSRYTTAKPPLYTNPGEAGLSSPAVVNDVVFVSTSKTALYALRASDGLCLWQAPGMPSGGWPNFCLGPAVYGNYVVVGAASKVLIYKLPPVIIWPWPWLRELPWWLTIIERLPIPPPPEPDPFGPRPIEDILTGGPVLE